MPRRLLNVALVLLAALLVANAVAIAAPATPATFTVNHIMVANPEANTMAFNYAMINEANLDANNTANNAVAANVLATNANTANVLLNADEAAQDHNIGAPRKLPNQAANNLANNIAANARYRTPAKI